MMRAMDAKVVAACRAAFPGKAPSIVLGAPIHSGDCHPEPLVRIPLEMLNRHGLIAGATGTGKTKTLQLMAEQISAAGVPVFLADVKGDLSGLAVAGEDNPRVAQRAKETGSPWHGAAFAVEFLSLTGARGAQLRATVSSFGPLLLSKVLGLNDTQTSVLRLVFKYCDDRAEADRRHLEGLGRCPAARDGRARAAGSARLLRRAGLRARGLAARRARRTRPALDPRADRRAGQAGALLDFPHVALGKALQRAARGR
jgi:DNA helicase HerA-like ATPase